MLYHGMVMNSAVPLPCGGYLLRNVFLEVSTLCDDVERKLIGPFIKVTIPLVIVLHFLVMIVF